MLFKNIFGTWLLSSNKVDILISWLVDAIGGAGPISSTKSAIATVTLAGVSFNLYKGPNGSTTVYSFVASSAVSAAISKHWKRITLIQAFPQATSFSGDIKAFLTYLINNQSFPKAQYLTSIGAGTEPFTGSSAVFTTSAYSLVVN